MTAPIPPSYALAQRIKQLRTLHGLNQAQLAQSSGLTPAAISQIEAGDRIPAFKTVLALAKALKTTPDDLMGQKVEGLDPSLRELSGLFRDLKQVSPEDLDKVKSFAQWLLLQKQDPSR